MTWKQKKLEDDTTKFQESSEVRKNNNDNNNNNNNKQKACHTSHDVSNAVVYLRLDPTRRWPGNGEGGEGGSTMSKGYEYP